MTDRQTQYKSILKYLEDGGVITQRIASERFGCDRLSARIWELRHDGIRVIDGWDGKLDENGKVVKRWKKYFLARGSAV